jgi:xylose isomerase
MLDYDKNLHILVEPKPNEPMDQAYIPTVGHALALGYRTADPSRMGILIETAHQILAGPSMLAKNDPCLLSKNDPDRKHVYARRSQSLPTL